MTEREVAISMHQPYASLLLSGDKEFETRGKRYNLVGRGRIWIQAAQVKRSFYVLARDKLLNEICIKAFGAEWQETLPKGKLLGWVRFDEMVTTSFRRDFQTPAEIAVGDWSPGRFAFHVLNRHTLATPVRCRGMQAVPFPINCTEGLR